MLKGGIAAEYHQDVLPLAREKRYARTRPRAHAPALNFAQ